MPIWLQPLCDAIRLNQVGPIARAFMGLNLQDTVEAVSFTGPERLQSVLMYGPNVWPRPVAVSQSARANQEHFDIETVVRTVLAHWRIGTVQHLPTEQVATIRAAITRVGDLREERQRCLMDREVSAVLPAPSTNPPRLGPADIVTAAQRMRAEPAAIHAVASVESRGDGFDAQGRPKILFEAHHFRRLSGAKFDTTHPHLSRPYARTAAFRKFYRWDQWSRMYEALLLDKSAALQAASWGKFQVMGFNHNGWPDVFGFANAMFVGESTHLQTFLAFVADNGLTGALRRPDFEAFTRGYNGADGIANGYHTRMRAAYDAYKRTHR